MMFLSGKSLFVNKECVNPGFRDKMLDFFNKDIRPVTLTLAANVTTLSEKKTEQVLFMHPHNLADTISEKVGDSESDVDAASISFNDNTCILEVCLGREIDVQIYLNSKERVK